MTLPAGHAGGRPLRGQLVRSAYANLGGRLLSMALWLVVTRAVLSGMGPTRFGFWSLASTLAGFSLTLDFGLSAAVTRFVATYRTTGDAAAMRGVVNLGLLMSLLLGVGWLAIVLLWPAGILSFANVPGALRPEAARTLVWMGGVFVVNLLVAVLAAALAGFQRFDLVNRNLLISTLVQLLGMMLVLSRGGGLAALAAAVLAGTLVSAGLSWVSLRRVWPEFRLAAPRSARMMFGGFGGFGLALQVIQLGVLGLYQGPKFLFARFLSLDQVGQYELGYRVAFSAWSLPTLLLPPLLPAASQMDAAREHDRLRRLYLQGSRYLLAVAFPLSSGLVALSPVFFLVWLGPGHANEARAQAAISGLLGVNVLTSVGSFIARGMARPWWEAGYLGFAAVLQVLLGTWLVQARGFRGGLLGLAIAGVLGTAWFLIVFHRAIGIPLGAFLRDVVAAPLAAALLGGGAAWLVAGRAASGAFAESRGHALLSLGLGGAALATVSIAVLFATRALTLAEIRQLASHIRPAPGVPGAPQ